MLRRALLVFLLGILSAFATASPGTAQASGNELLVNGVHVIQFSAALGAISPNQRAQNAADKIRSLPYWGVIDVGESGAQRTLMIGDETVAVVSQGDAVLAKLSVSELAKEWASKLQDALNITPLKVSDNYLRIPVGSSGFIGVSGSLAARATADSSDPKVAHSRGKRLRHPRGFGGHRDRLHRGR
jgi:hypothetical protein